MRLAARYASLSALLLVAGCGTAPPRSRMPSADDALGRMHDTYACVNAVGGTGKIDVFATEGRIRGDVALIAANPDRVRFDIISPFGALIYTLTSDGQRFEMTDNKEKQFLYGPAKPCNLARLTRVPIPGHALVSLLRGEAPVLVHTPAAASIDWDRSGGFYRVLLPSTRDAREEIHLGIRPEDFDKPWQEQRVRVLEVLVAQRGVDLYRADLDNHKPAQTAPPREDPDGLDESIPPSGPTCDAELPRSIRMRVPHTNADVILQYKDEARWNVPLVADAFKQPIPGGSRQVYVDCDTP
jgi:hypothetical protein